MGKHRQLHDLTSIGKKYKRWGGNYGSWPTCTILNCKTWRCHDSWSNGHKSRASLVIIYWGQSKGPQVRLINKVRGLKINPKAKHHINGPSNGKSPVKAVPRPLRNTKHPGHVAFSWSSSVSKNLPKTPQEEPRWGLVCMKTSLGIILPFEL